MKKTNKYNGMIYGMCIGVGVGTALGVVFNHTILEVEYLDMNWKKQKLKLDGWTAQICQHELDHLEGILI